MATHWLGRAAAVAGVKAVTISGTVTIGDVFTITCNGKSISFTATAGTAANVVAGLVTLLNASTIPEFAEITWSDATPAVHATHDTAGEDFDISASTTSVATFVVSTVTAATGPTFWNNANNWSGGAVPVSTDDVVIDIPVSIRHGLNQSAVTLDSLTVTARFQDNAEIGLPRRNAGGYTEYRRQYLAISATSVLIGTGEGSGSRRINLDLGSVASAVEVRRTAAPAEVGLAAVNLLVNHASTTIDCRQGTSVGIAANDGDASLYDTLSIAEGAQVFVGNGAVGDTIRGGGLLQCGGTVDDVLQYGGDWVLNGSTGLDLLDQARGRLRYNSSGTVTLAKIGGVLDCSADMTPRTFTACELRVNGRIQDPGQSITYTNGLTRDSLVREITAS